MNIQLSMYNPGTGSTFEHLHKTRELAVERRVAIIGAGITGFLACKYALSKGFNPIVYEAQDQVGGLWTKTIESTRLQNSKELFQFSDFPWPDSITDMFPKSAQLLEYLESYAQHFQLLPCVKFNSKVISIDYVGPSEEEMESWELWGGVGKSFGSKGKWNIQVHDTKEDSTKECEVEFVVLCIGRFSGLPNIPKFGSGYGPEVFSGKVLHSMDYAEMENAAAAEFIKGKRIAVIGSGKSAVDIAFECAQANGVSNPCTIIRRTTHWTIPSGDVKKWRFYFGIVCTRGFESMVRKPGEGFLSSVLATLSSTRLWLFSKFVEHVVERDLPLKKYDMIPNASLVQEVASCQVFFLPENFYDKVEEGSILLKKSQQLNFREEGLILDGEADPVKVDIVIFATGYKGDEKLSNIFVSSKFQNYITGSPTTPIPLYRQMVLPRVPQLAILGYSESLSNLYMFEMKCQWLSHFLDGTFDLPSIKEMEKDVKTWEKYMKRYAGNGKFRRSCIAGVSIWYSDQLCKDIGCNPMRKKGFFANLLQPHGLADYKGLGPET